jgi:hypothetical protein
VLHLSVLKVRRVRSKPAARARSRTCSAAPAQAACAAPALCTRLQAALLRVPRGSARSSVLNQAHLRRAAPLRASAAAMPTRASALGDAGRAQRRASAAMARVLLATRVF